jgi:AcrR family transcriptional regulator
MKTTYESILEVSKNLFLEKGYSATSLREIAEACGIAKATVYHHFKEKESILLALVEETDRGQRSMIEAIKAQAEPRARIETAVRENLRFLASITGIIQTARRELAHGRELSQTRYGPTIVEFRSLLAGALAEGSASGIFRPLEPEKAAAVLMAMVQGSIASAMFNDGQMEEPDSRAEAILDIFFRGVLA